MGVSLQVWVHAMEEQNRASSNVRTIGHPAGFAPPFDPAATLEIRRHSNAEKIAHYVCMNITIVSATRPVEP
jgi:hypothetical protein